MEIKRFEKVNGSYVEKIFGQQRYGYVLSQSTDFYEILDLDEIGAYAGSILTFYDYETGKVFEPLELEDNVLCGRPVYLENSFWFLQYDHNNKIVRLYRYVPDSQLEMVKEFDSTTMNLYNLMIIGEKVHVVSSDDDFVCYYPEEFHFPLNEHESVTLIEDDKVYLDAWVEEGWDDENNCATKDYKYYTKLIIKDKNGNLLSEEVGSLEQQPDGTWWIS